MKRTRWRGGLVLILLGLVACSNLHWGPTPPPPLREQEVVIATPTPAAVAVQVQRAWVYPAATLSLPAPAVPVSPALTLSPTLGLGATALGVFLVVEARLTNTGSTPLSLHLAEIYGVDAGERIFTRAGDAEFALALHGYPLLPERAVPPGVTTPVTLVLDAPADYAAPLQLVLRWPGTVSELWSAPFPVETAP